MHFQKTQRLKVSSNIYSRRNGQIIVLGGGHGHSTGGNWFPIENSSDMAYKYPDEVILNELTRGIGLIDEDLDPPQNHTSESWAIDHGRDQCHNKRKTK